MMSSKAMMVFPLYEEMQRITASLSDEQFGQLIRYGMACYYNGQTRESEDPVVRVLGVVLMEQVSRYDRYRREQSEKRKKRNKMPEQGTQTAEDTSPEQGTQTAEDTSPEQGTQTEETKADKGEQKGTNANKRLPPNPSPNPSPSPSPSPNPSPNPSPSPSPNPDPGNMICSKALELLNRLSGSSFRAATRATQRLIAARIKEGFTPEDIETVIRHRHSLWGNDPKMRPYLRPETLFGSKFESYLSDAKRRQPEEEYILAPLEDPWDTAMRRMHSHG